MRLTAEQRTGWIETGWLLLPGLFDATTVAQLSGWIDEVAGWAAAGGPGLHHRELTDHGPALARSEDLVPHHDGLRRFIVDGLVAELVGALFGEPAALFKEKINYKQPGGAGFAPHQDATAYRFVDHHISCMVPLDPATASSGCLDVAPCPGPVVLPHDGGRISSEVVGSLSWQPVEVRPGDLLAFDSYTPHRSGTNTTDRPRRALYLTYNVASRGDFRTTYYADKRAELATAGSTGERVRVSINDDFLGRPVPGEP